MCRMLGYCARDRASLAEVTGERGLRDFTKLSAFHGDGWGMAWYDDRQGHVEKSPRRAADEPAYGELAHRRLGDLGLVHLRRATPGLPVEVGNSHPFRHGEIIMAHNGAIHPQDQLGDLLTPAWQRRLTGTTDSERYFLHVMSRLEENPADLIAALHDAVAHIDRTFTANSLNAIFLTPDALYSLCWYHQDRIPPVPWPIRAIPGRPNATSTWPTGRQTTPPWSHLARVSKPVRPRCPTTTTSSPTV